MGKITVEQVVIFLLALLSISHTIQIMGLRAEIDTLKDFYYDNLQDLKDLAQNVSRFMGKDKTE